MNENFVKKILFFQVFLFQTGLLPVKLVFRLCPCSLLVKNSQFSKLSFRFSIAIVVLPFNKEKLFILLWQEKRSFGILANEAKKNMVIKFVSKMKIDSNQK